MATFQERFDDICLMHGWTPSDFSEPERQAILRKAGTLQNDIMRYVSPIYEKREIELMADVQEYDLGKNVGSVQSIALNNMPLTGRVSPQEIIIGLNT